MQPDTVAIVTKDRPLELAWTLDNIYDTCGFRAYIVVDGSEDTATADVCRRFSDRCRDTELEYVRSAPGTARQRNVAIDTALGFPCLERLWWFDDDGDVRPGYREILEGVLDGDPRLGGAGGVAEDDLERLSGRLAGLRDAFKRLFLLHGREGVVLPSGRNIQVRRARDPIFVDWLQGGACVFVRPVLEQVRYDERLVGASWGEDFDYSYRVSRRWPLVVHPDARIHNRFGGEDRSSPGGSVCTRTVLLHAWVRERSELSIAAFWWSIIGELLLIGVAAVLRQRPGRSRELRGLLEGVAICARGASRRDFVSGSGPSSAIPT